MSVRGRRATGDGATEVRRRLWSDLGAIVVVVGLLAAVSFLPPDTTLAQVRATGVLRVCVPDAFPPLVTGRADEPGVDVEILHTVADELGVRLQLVRNSAIGRDFNPRNWRVTRAQCLLIAGGVVDTTTTRGFLVVTTPHLETGWVAVTRAGETPTSLEGVPVGFYAGITGLDRLALSRWLRDQGAEVTVVSSRSDAASGLEQGRYDVLVSEALTARGIAGELGASPAWLPVTTAPIPVGFGMWKGDLTLERAVEAVLRGMRRDGRLAAITDRYELVPADDACAFCR
jgi:ABC-type amino acid transport substrate-binding protein